MLMRTEDKSKLARLLAWFLTETVTISRPAHSTDDTGNLSTTWATVATVNGRVLPIRATAEAIATGAEAGHEIYRLIVTPDADLAAKDRVTVGGVAYEVTQLDAARTDAVDRQARVKRLT